MNSAYYLTFANQRWLSVRLDAIGNLLVFTVGILVVTARFSISPSTGGLVLSYILSIVQMIQFTVRQLAEVENNMNSTERIHYYGTQLDEEPPLQGVALPPSWPQHGQISFDHVEMRYRPGLPLVLRGLTLDVAGAKAPSAGSPEFPRRSGWTAPAAPCSPPASTWRAQNATSPPCASHRPASGCAAANSSHHKRPWRQRAYTAGMRSLHRHHRKAPPPSPTAESTLLAFQHDLRRHRNLHACYRRRYWRSAAPRNRAGQKIEPAPTSASSDG